MGQVTTGATPRMVMSLHPEGVITVAQEIITLPPPTTTIITAGQVPEVVGELTGTVVVAEEVVVVSVLQEEVVVGTIVMVTEGTTRMAEQHHRPRPNPHPLRHHPSHTPTKCCASPPSIPKHRTRWFEKPCTGSLNVLATSA